MRYLTNMRPTQHAEGWKEPVPGHNCVTNSVPATTSTFSQNLFLYEKVGLFKFGFLLLVAKTYLIKSKIYGEK